MQLRYEMDVNYKKRDQLTVLADDPGAAIQMLAGKRLDGIIFLTVFFLFFGIFVRHSE